MAQGQAGKTQAVGGAYALQAERGLAGVVAIGAQGDLVAAQGLDGFEQLAHVAGGFAVIQRSHQFKRLLHAFQVGRELRFELVVEHGGFLKIRVVVL